MDCTLRVSFAVVDQHRGQRPPAFEQTPQHKKLELAPVRVLPRGLAIVAVQVGEHGVKVMRRSEIRKGGRAVRAVIPCQILRHLQAVDLHPPVAARHDARAGRRNERHQLPPRRLLYAMSSPSVRTSTSARRCATGRNQRTIA